MEQIDNFIDKKESENEEKIKETPLSVRVDSYYKDLFLELSEQPGYNRKRLLESMINSYVRDRKEENRQNELSLEHEINLISGSLDDILKVFKAISIKAQDTIGSERTLHEQEIENLKRNIETLELKIQGIEDERKKVTIENKELELRNQDICKENKKLIDEITYLKDEAKKTKDAHSAVLNEVYNLRHIESENFKIISENKELLLKIDELKATINKKDKETEKQIYNYEILETKKDKETEMLQIQLEELSKRILSMKESKENELKEAENLIRKEIEIKKETEILQLKQEYNNLQMKYITDIGELKK